MVNDEGQFEALSNRIRDLSENHKLSCFLSGLKDEVRSSVKMLNPKNINEAFSLAKIQEEYLMSSKKIQKPFSLELSKPSILGPRPDIKLDSKFKEPLQRLSPAQKEERRKKGLCFNCDEKFQLGHHYKSAKILLLKGLYPFQGPISNVQLIELNDTDIPLSLEFDMLHSESVESKPKMAEVEITLYALLGSPSPSTMRIKGKINRHWVVILIDYFLDAAILSKLQLFLDPIVSFEVKVANGATIKTKDVCLDVKVVMQGHIFSVNLNALPLEDCELVLGTQWLRTLGLIQSDFLAMSMQFLHLGTTVTLFGMHPTNLTLQKGDHFFRKAVRKGILLQIMSLGLGTSSSQQQCDPLIEKLPIEFSLVFDTSSGLPPYRGYEHQILLNEGTALICQRPYRYPHFQKIEIEKIVTDLLEVGSIRPSQSPFSSPVLLVRKADGSWRMCIDYRALN